MSVRGVGDAHAVRRLWWLFSGTILAPGLLLGLMAFGAFGHAQWTAAETATQRVDAQLPLLVELLAPRVEALDRRVRSARSRCPDADCTPPEGVADWSVAADGTVRWEPDREALLDTVRAAFRSPEDWPVQLEITAARPGAYLLPSPLQRLALAAPVPDGQRPGRLRMRAFLAVLGLVAVLVTGVTLGMGAAAREIRMSQRQTALVQRVSHELRTPLTSIQMFVDTLRAGRLPQDRTSECLDLLSQETDRLGRRIEEVLNWARMEAGARRYHVEPVRPHTLVDDALAAFRTQILFEDHELRLAVDVDEDAPALLVDHDAIVEALVNLLVNAFRHTTAPRHIEVSTRVEGRRVGLAVRDDGPGIPRRDRRRIFEKFYQATDEVEDTRPTQGSGLGLAIVRAIVRAHAGRIQLQTAEDDGSTFILWLPVA